MLQPQLPPIQKRKSFSFFVIIGIVGLFAVLIGFGKTFIIPSINGSFDAPFIVHLHGAFAFSWILLFLVQTILIHVRNYRLHQILGILGTGIAIGIGITIVFVGKYVVSRDLSQGLGEISYSSLIGNITSASLFLLFVLLGILKRNDPASHKRFMLLATIIVLWPAWFRFRHYFPAIPRPDIWFAVVLADSLIITAWIWDKVKNGKIHPALLFWGLFVILEQSFEVIVYDSEIWRSISKGIYGIL